MWPDPKTPAEAAKLLRDGQLCAFPTETVYGLGADATNADAVLSIFETKGRPRFNPLIVHCADAAMARRYAEFSPLAELLTVFWPGSLTLVLPMRAGSGVVDLVTGGLATLGLRVPDHPLARQMIADVGRPIAGPSANPSGRLSPTSAEQVREGFGGRVPVLDGGPCRSGLESTILAVEGERAVQLRPGALPREEIEAALGRKIEVVQAGAAVQAPGMLLSHYAPRAGVRLGANGPKAGEGFLAFGPAPEGEGPVLNLSPSGDLREAARNLFAMLNELDRLGVDRIAVAPIPEAGLGEAINDRLRRAAAPRT
jgi:L-threonylcarbamoyladenylate synthase